ncbi:carboxylesterase/lipase family protein [Pseudomonas sp. OIL-1]|uniref:carboxylesterase/lipase family protein n=1 Tax=Pseudomonas sp. OIL-1 TaxID=2706126 RepID=UPI0013A721C6|nr:carboxylesterase family protein [Pseudomonas sp. OIL-1]QIB52287.1 carboxylesterase family protein [Pseudomonas sp. OIL-1]
MDVIRITSTGFTAKILALSLTATLLSGCLSGGGGGSSASPASSEPAPEVETPPAAPADPLTAITTLGSFKGVSENGMRVFRGIRYGEAERFAAPILASSHDRLIELKDFGDACAQPDTSFGAYSAIEDCLFLNVYAPESPGDYPVMVWIHGGALLGGSGGTDYEPERLVEHGVVVVTLNYRLGALGFLPHSSLGDTNFGLQDQQLALQWVQQNIGAFDGDADNVTIFGESAGGHSVLSHIASPSAAGLFHRAIVQSGSYNGDQLPLNAAPDTVLIGASEAFDGETRIGAPIIQRIREKSPDVCAEDTALLDCLRAVDLDTILTSQTEVLAERQIESVLPVYHADSRLLPISINTALTSGDFNKVPVLMGSNLDEGDLFMLISSGSGWTYSLPSSYRPVVANLIKENSELDSDEVADHYLLRARALIAADPLKQAELAKKDLPTQYAYDYVYAYSLIVTDWRFNCPNQKQWSQLQDQVDTYGYWFADRDSSDIYRAIRAATGVNIPDVFPLGASHAFELPYLLNNQESFDLGDPSGAQQVLSEQMLSYWANFAKYGDPNSVDGSAASVEWPRYTPGGNVMRLETPAPKTVSMSDFRAQHNCSFWDEPPLRNTVE